MGQYAPVRKRRQTRTRVEINVHQNKFPKGYISTYLASRRPTDSLSDCTNAEITLDNTPRPRPPLVRYGTQSAYTIIGRGNFKWNGQRGLLFMLNVGGVGKIYYQYDGGAMTLVGGTYAIDGNYAGFCQSMGRVYVYNGKDNLTFVKLSDMTIQSYTSIATPVISSVVKGGLSGTTYTQYYRISANNAVGESIASVVGSVTIGKVRDAWINGTDYIDISWGAVAGATSYTVYTGDTATVCEELTSVAGTSYRDDGQTATNIYKLAPEGNSTAGYVFVWMYNDPKNSQVYGVDTKNNLAYSAPGTGDFSSYNGGGYVGIDVDGDTTLNFVDGFRTGKGDPVITVSSRGAAGKGKLNHVTFDSLTIGSQILVYPNVFEANGQAGTYAPRCTVKAGNSLTYPTGDAIKSTDTSQNIVNVLVTNTISYFIQPDIDKIDLANLHKAVGIEYKDIIYMALPVSSTENNEIWYVDRSRKNLWVLRWPVAARDMWLYEDSKGVTHFCVLVNNIILEFTRAGSMTTQDDGVAWNSRVAFDALVWDPSGIIMANIRNQYAKLLYPRGYISMNSYGLSQKGESNAVGDDTFTTETSHTGIGQWDYSGDYQYGDDPGQIQVFAKSSAVLRVKPKGLLNQLSWEIITSGANCDYYLSSVNTRGTGHTNLIYKG